MAKIHFRSYNPNQIVLFPQRIDENIPSDDPVRILNAMVDSFDLSSFHKLYKESGRSAYHPRMMLKAVLYAYMNNIYSCRKIEKSLLRDIHFIWLAGYEKPDYRTINRFRNRVKDEINGIFTQIVLILASKGFISLDVEYVDGTKIESKANRYTFVWRKNVERNRARLLEKIRILLQQIDDVVAQEDACIENTATEFTPSMLTDMISELKASLENVPTASDKEEKKTKRQKAKQINLLESHCKKLAEYNRHMRILGKRNSYSKTDPDATFMHMKEDPMGNGQLKPGYNLQIGTENQFMLDFGLFHNPTDTLTLIPFENSFHERYNRFPLEEVADSGYGSEENYRFMEENGIEAYVKYNFFHKEQRADKYVTNPFKQENLYYNKEKDYYVCPMGQHMKRTGVRHYKTESGYIAESIAYRAARCEGCPLRCMCFSSKSPGRTIEVNHRLKEYKQKARERLTSEKGSKHRGQSVHADAVDLHAVVGGDEEVFAAIDDARFDHIAVLRCNGNFDLGGRDLKLLALDDVVRVQRGVLAVLLIALALERCDLLVVHAAVGEDAADVARRHFKRLGVFALLVIFDARSDLLVHGLDDIVAAILVERVGKRRAKGVFLLLGRHRRVDVEQRVDDLLMDLRGIFRVEQHIVNVRRAVVECGVEEAELGRGRDVAGGA